MKILNVLQAAEHVATIATLTVGAVWAYYRFLKDRVYHIRLQTSICGKVYSHAGREVLRVSIRVRNAGLSRVSLQRSGSGFRVRPANEYVDDELDVVDWGPPATLPILEEHGWIESGETVTEEHLLGIPAPGAAAFRLEFRVVSQGLVFRSSAVAVRDGGSNDLHGMED